MKLPGMIYDRMVQNAREARDRDERDCDRPGQRERRLRKRQREELAALRASTAPPKEEEPKPEKLFGDPPKAVQKSSTEDIVGLVLFFLGIAWFAALMIGFTVWKNEKNSQPTPMEVEK